jgi:hypothetical protein
MNRQKTFCVYQNFIGFKGCCVIPGLLLFLLLFSSYARMTPDDLKAIYETGLIPLTDDQEGIYKSGRDYLVFETMRIKRGDTVVFTPGARIFFHSNAKITVHGALILHGTADEPITIGKLNVTIPKLTPKVKMNFDSTSFYVYRTATLVMQHVGIADSTISFRFTDSTSEFTMDSVRCAGNRLSLPDTLLHLWPNVMVTCSKSAGKLSHPCIPPPINTSKIVVNHIFTWEGIKSPVRIGLGLGVTAAAAAWYFHNNKASQAVDDYHAIESDAGDFGSRKEINNIARRNRNIAGFVAACGAAALSLTFYIGGGE